MAGESVSNALELRGVSCSRNGVGVGPIDLVIPAGQLTVFRGATNSGKELLLRICGLLERPDAGEMLIHARSAGESDDATAAELRRSHFGYLFAAPFLLPAFTVIENVVMPIFKLLDAGPAEARVRAEELLAFVGVSQFEQERAGDLPHFEQRCVALARALATQPSVLLVEELDQESHSEQLHCFAKLLREVCRQLKVTVIATASPAWCAAIGDHVFEIRAGKAEIATVPISSS